MDAEELLGVTGGEAGDDVPAPVASLGGKALVPEHVRHQLREEVAHLSDVEARLARPVGERVAR
jgi:hypothetical protein